MKKIVKYLILFFSSFFLLISVYFYYTDSRIEMNTIWVLSNNSYLKHISDYILRNKKDDLRKSFKNNIFTCNENVKKIKWIKDERLSNLRVSYNYSDEKSPDIVKLETNDYDWMQSHYFNDFKLENNDSLRSCYELHFVTDNDIVIKTDSLINHWVYIASKERLPSIYAIEFDYKSHTRFYEQLQLDFCANSLADRYRIISEYGNNFFFDKVQNGFFLKRFIEINKKFNIYEYNKFRLEIIENNVFFFLNNEQIFSLRLPCDMINVSGYFLLLFWNRNDNIPINISIKNYSVYVEEQSV